MCHRAKVTSTYRGFDECCWLIDGRLPVVLVKVHIEFPVEIRVAEREVPPDVQPECRRKQHGRNKSRDYRPIRFLSILAHARHSIRARMSELPMNAAR